MSKEKTDLSTRMKGYESCYDFKVPARTYTIIRLDGKNFSKYTKMFEKPFDGKLSNVMDVATARLCEELNPKFAYTQSDEISLVFTDIENINSQMVFDGKVQKLCSIAASKVTSAFNSTMLRVLTAFTKPEEIIEKIHSGQFKEMEAVFDARVFIIPDFREVSNYFIWRQQDASRNSVSMAASSVYSHKELNGKSSSEKQDMLMEKGINWNDYLPKYKRGVVIKKMPYFVEGDVIDGEQIIVERKKWLPIPTPIFTQEKEFLYDLIPTIEI